MTLRRNVNRTVSTAPSTTPKQKKRRSPWPCGHSIICPYELPYNCKANECVSNPSKYCRLARRASGPRDVRRRSSSRSFAPCVRIGDHGLLANLYFAILEGAGALVDVQDSTGGGQLRVDEPKAARDRALTEEALAGAENHGELPDAQRIDEIVLEQGLEGVAAAVDLDLAALLCLELRDLLGNVALEQDGVVPRDLIERPRSDEFRSGVEGRGNLVRRVGGLGPGACEDLIGLAAEEEGAGALGPLGHDLAHLFVEIGD